MLLDQPKTAKKGDYDADIGYKSPPRILVLAWSTDFVHKIVTLHVDSGYWGPICRSEIENIGVNHQMGLNKRLLRKKWGVNDMK